MDQTEESYIDRNYLFPQEESICKNATVGTIEEESFPYQDPHSDKSLAHVFECLTIANNQQSFTSPYQKTPDNMQKLALEFGNTNIGRSPSYVPEDTMMEIEEHVARSVVGSLKTAEKGKEHK